LIGSEKNTFIHNPEDGVGTIFSSFSLGNVRSAPLFMAALGAATVILRLTQFGLVLNGIGLVISQGNIVSSSFNQLGLSWFFQFLYILWVVIVFAVVGSKAQDQYRLLINSLTTLVWAAVPSDFERAVLNNSFKIPGSTVRMVGYIFLILPTVILNLSVGICIVVFWS
jgi:hypothetical protein